MQPRRPGLRLRPKIRYPRGHEHVKVVDKVSYDEVQYRVFFNAEQYFEGVPPEVWNFPVGGYQVCQKWLKDRLGRVLSVHDLICYQKIIVAIQETRRIMAEIDALIQAHGGWPLP